MRYCLSILLAWAVWLGTVTVADAGEPSIAPRLLLVKGVWWRHFRADEAMGDMGYVRWKSAWHGRYLGKESLRGFGANATFLNRFGAIMVMNVGPEAMGKAGVDALAAYVQDGGGLFLLGGPYFPPTEKGSFGALEGLLPGTLPPGRARVPLEGGAVIELTAEGKAFFREVPLRWERQPRVYFRHPAVAAADATVLLRCGGEPLLMIAQRGEGRVALFAASVEGDPAPEATAFWDWEDFAPLVAEVNRWLLRKPSGRVPALSKAVSAHLAALPTSDIGVDADAMRKAIRAILPECHDADTAHRLLTAARMTPLGTGDALFLDMSRAIAPFADQEWAEEIAELADHPDAPNAALGLSLLGFGGGADAGPTLLRALADGAAVLDNRGEESESTALGTGPVFSMRDPGAEAMIRLGAVLGLGYLGDAEHLEALRRATAQFAAHRQGFADQGLELFLAEELYQESLVSRLRLGDGTAVPLLRDVILKTVEEVEGCYNYFDNMIAYALKNNPIFQKGLQCARARVGELHLRLDTRLAQLETLPAAMRRAFLLSVTEWEDPILSELAYWATLPDAQADAAWLSELAEKSRSPALVRYARRGLRLRQAP